MRTTCEPLLSVDNLRTHIFARRGIVHAVDGVSFDLDAGKTLAIVGESGCGKSVLCRTIMGLLPEHAETGAGSSIQFGGQQIVGLKEDRYRQFRATRMAVIFQDSLSSLHPVMTVGRQIAESLRYHLNMSRGRAKERAVHLIRTVGLPEPQKCAGRYPHQLSGGMRQRIAIAIALACNPALLIADEPTTSLDVTVQAGILALLNHLQVDRGMAIILVTHDLGVASNVADRIAVMYAGKILEIAAASDLLEEPRHPYTKLLIDSVLQIDQPVQMPRAPLDRRPCDLVHLPAGCRYSSRCPKADDRCRKAEPGLRAGQAAHHFFACWHPLGGV